MMTGDMTTGGIRREDRGAVVDIMTRAGIGIGTGTGTGRGMSTTETMSAKTEGKSPLTPAERRPDRTGAEHREFWTTRSAYARRHGRRSLPHPPLMLPYHQGRVLPRSRTMTSTPSRS